MSVNTAEIELLIQNARTGIDDSRARLFQHSQPMLELWSRSYDKLLHRMRLSCRDLCQDVMVIVQKNFHLFKGTTASSWFAWLKRIHHRILTNLIRQKANRITLEASLLTNDEDAAVSDQFVSKSATPGSLAILKEQSDRVKEVLNAMNPDQRQALNAWMDGLTLEEHAILLGVRIHTVRYLRFKALEEFNALWKTFQTNP